jgi:hypothetical protein
MTMTAVSRHAEVRERNANARKARKRANDVLQAARSAQDGQAEAVAMLALDRAQQDVEVGEALERTLLSQMAGIGSSSGVGTFLDDPSTVSTLEQLASSSMPIGNLMLGPAVTAEQFVARGGRFASTGTGPGSGPALVPDDSRIGLPYGIVPQLYRPTFLLDFIPHSVMDALYFSYLKESGSLDSGAAETAELALKLEELGLDLSQEGEVRAVTIAAYKKLGRQEIADVAGLANIIESRLVYLISRRIESEIVNGDGVGDDMLGILNQTGIGAVAYDATKPASDLLLAGLTQVRLANGQPSAILLNPNTYASMLEAKATGSGERLDSGGAFESPADSIWGVKVIQSAIVGTGQAIVADWGRATTLYVREAVNARVSDADQDDFIRNRVTMLAEARVGLAVWQPSAIVVVDLA